MNNKYVWLCSVLALVLSTLNVQAKVSSQEADKLGKSLTPFGSIKSGNKDKTIPAWTGGITEWPAGYKGSGQHHIDPYASETPKFTIDKTNYKGFVKRLSPGQYNLFEQYPDTFKMHIYPTHRSHSMPEWTLENTKKNAKTAVLTKGGLGIKGAYGGIPFPILHGSNTDKALQATWNHMTRWRGSYVNSQLAELAIDSSGDFSPVVKKQEVLFNFFNPNESEETLDNILFYYRTANISPALYAGGAVLVHETLDQSVEERRAWIYIKGTGGKTPRAPNVKYDAPVASSGDTRVADDTDMYNGVPNLYDWEYKGVQEFFIPYNNYKVNSAGVEYKDLVMPGHMNPEYTRWEMHRVHVVEANLKQGENHIYSKRVFYIDEDSWSIALIDKYGSRGDLSYMSIALLMNFYELPGTWTAGNIHHDFKSGRYSINGLYAESKSAPEFSVKIKDEKKRAKMLSKARRNLKSTSGLRRWLRRK